MNEKEILNDIMKTLNVNRMTLGEMAGYRSKSAITEILNRQGMKIDILLKLLTAMDCKLIVRHEGTDKEWVFGE